MQRMCTQCQASFEITNDDLAFLDQLSPVIAGKKYEIPPPTHCPDCRQQRRLSYCNEQFFYQTICVLCAKRIITEQPPENPCTIYCRECWQGDRWDPCDFGRGMDFSRSFFDQFQEMRLACPVQNLLSEGTNVNSDYIHYAGFAKNCYLIMHADFCEDCYYGYGFKRNRSCADGFYNLQCELCYDCVDVHGCYDLKSCQDCRNCNTGAFLRDCIGCKNCFLCVGLRNKEYFFENKQLTKEEYEATIDAIDLGSHVQYEAQRPRLKALELLHTFRQLQTYNVENCSGDHLANCKNTHSSFDCEDVEDGKFLYQVVTGAKNDYDIYQYGLNLQESYECSIAGNDTYHALFSHNVHVSCNDVTYCWRVQSCKFCFGCANMHHKQYCILNKQYTKEEYEQLVPKIIAHMKKSGEWGELFPVAHSPFGYNKTSAQQYYLLTRERAIAKGWKWDDMQEQPSVADRTIRADQVPDNIDDVPDDILQWAIVCEVTGKPFKIIAQELKFYRQQRLPIPRRNWIQRHKDRFLRRNPRKFWERPCMKCGKAIQTSYSPERPEIVYCEECYLATVY